MVDQDDAAFADTLTKLLRRAETDPQSLDLFRVKLKGRGLTMHDVRIEVGKENEVERLRRRVNELEMVAPREYSEFEALAEAKGYYGQKAMAALVRRDFSFILSCKKLGRIPYACFYLMALAPDLRQKRVKRVELSTDRPRRKKDGLDGAKPEKRFAAYPEAYARFRNAALEAIQAGERHGIAREILQPLSVPKDLSGLFAKQFRSDFPQHANFFPERRGAHHSEKVQAESDMLAATA